MINEYLADPGHSSAHFNLENLVIPDVEGDFASLSGKFIYDPDHLDQCRIEAFIDVRSVTTGDALIDAQLKSVEFFHLAHYPQIKFISKSIEAFDKDVLKVYGDLTIKEITKEVVLNVERPDNTIKKKISLVASTLVNRVAFGLELSSILNVGEILVGDNIQITMDIKLTKKN
jgi:polyisoprenoid-binding protein YceI